MGSTVLEYLKTTISESKDILNKNPMVRYGINDP